MKKSDKEKILARIFKKTFNIKKFRTELSMENTPEWDSLKHLQLLNEIEKAFNIEIQFENSLKMTSVKGILEIISCQKLKINYC